MHERIQITPASALIKVRLLDDSTQDLINHYKSTLKWWQDEYNFGGRTVKSPRLISLMGDKDYFYSGVNHVAQPWDEITLALRTMATARLVVEIPAFESVLRELPYNGVLFNHYRDGRDSIGTHSDKEDGIDLNTPIMSINLGATRTFHIHTRNDVISVPLANGDCVWMIGRFQQELRHSVPKEPGTGERINLTFRRLV